MRTLCYNVSFENRRDRYVFLNLQEGGRGEEEENENSKKKKKKKTGGFAKLSFSKMDFESEGADSSIDWHSDKFWDEVLGTEKDEADESSELLAQLTEGFFCFSLPPPPSVSFFFCIPFVLVSSSSLFPSSSPFPVCVS